MVPCSQASKGNKAWMWTSSSSLAPYKIYSQSSSSGPFKMLDTACHSCAQNLKMISHHTQDFICKPLQWLRPHVTWPTPRHPNLQLSPLPPTPPISFPLCSSPNLVAPPNFNHVLASGSFCTWYPLFLVILFRALPHLVLVLAWI